MLIYLEMIDTPEDKSKFEQVYLEYRGLMFHVANQILQNTQDAEDAVHQAFVSIAENVQKISAPVCPKTCGYVVTIVESKAIDAYRKRQRHPAEEWNDEVAGISVPYQGSNGLADCILKLPARYRQVILLKYHQGYSVSEIAKLLAITEATAQKLDQRAKAKLMRICQEEGVL